MQPPRRLRGVKQQAASPGSTRVKDNDYAAIGERWLSRSSDGSADTTGLSSLRAFRLAGIDAERAQGALVHRLRHTFATEPPNSDVNVYTSMRASSCSMPAEGPRRASQCRGGQRRVRRRWRPLPLQGHTARPPAPAVSSTFVRRGNRTRWTASVRSTAERPGRQLQLTARFLGIRAVDNSAPDPVPVPLRRSSARKSSGSLLGSAKPPRSTPFKIGRLSIRTC